MKTKGKGVWTLWKIMAVFGTVFVFMFLGIIIFDFVGGSTGSGTSKEDGDLTIHFNLTGTDAGFDFNYNQTKEVTIKQHIGHYEVLELCRGDTWEKRYNMNCIEHFTGCGAVNCECWLL